MKIFIYKTLIVVLSFYLLFQLTVGQIFRSYETKIEDMLYNKQGRELILEKIKKEIRAANQKENIFTGEEKELLSNFINKIKKELNINNSE
tara:strand:- start:1459 stop:1731 length:273 start_codon:yes stop_codon:yes gene_type:complete